MDAQVVQAGEVRSARIESLRALAALGVVEGHVYGYAHHWNTPELYGTFLHRVILGGGSAVFVFFALSGYLLFWPFAKQQFGDGAPINLRRYALNRALRILPLYYVAVVLFMIVNEHGGNPSMWWRFGLLTWTFSTDTLGRVDGPLWSVVVEIHFYALLPFFAIALGWLTRRNWTAGVAVLLLLGLAGIGFREWALDRGPDTAAIVSKSLPGTFYFFIPGMLVAMLRLRSPRVPPAWLWLSASAVFWAIHFDRGYVGWAAALGSFTLLGAVVLARENGIVRTLDWRPLALAGVISYSIYVWHMPIVASLAHHTGWSYGPLLVLSLAVVMPVAFVSYRVIERPFLRLRRRWSANQTTTTLIRA